jgi:predicted SPOUT superfamily RNA methylase MTH1
MSNLFSWPPPKRKIKIITVVPVSILLVEQTLYEKTLLIGWLARALAMFRVDEVILFRDSESSYEDLEVMNDILNYLLIPPYIRKYVVGRKDTLRYVGLLPPLNISTHPLLSDDIELLPIREGVVLDVRGFLAKVYVGLRDYVVAEIPRDFSNGIRVGSRVLIKITKKKPLRGVIVDAESSPWYIGYKVVVADNIEKIINILRDPNVVGILTTKSGNDTYSVVKEVIGKDVRTLILLFGNHKKDFNELIGHEYSTLFNDLVKFKINTIPFQGVRSVRTVEAIYSTLAVVNELLYMLETYKH